MTEQQAADMLEALDGLIAIGTSLITISMAVLWGVAFLGAGQVIRHISLFKNQRRFW